MQIVKFTQKGIFCSIMRIPALPPSHVDCQSELQVFTPFFVPTPAVHLVKMLRRILCHDRIILVTICGKQVLMSRFGLSERTAIEAGIYRRASFAQIAKEIGTTARSVSEEIRRNRTLSPAAKFNGKDCRFAAECTRQCVCGDRFCRHECVFCRKEASSGLLCYGLNTP